MKNAANLKLTVVAGILAVVKHFSDQKSCLRLNFKEPFFFSIITFNNYFKISPVPSQQQFFIIRITLDIASQRQAVNEVETH